MHTSKTLKAGSPNSIRKLYPSFPVCLSCPCVFRFVILFLDLLFCFALLNHHIRVYTKVFAKGLQSETFSDCTFKEWV